MAPSNASDGGVSIITPSADAESPPPVEEIPSFEDPDDTLDAGAFFNDARKLISDNADVYIKRLAEAVAIQSLSTELSNRDECIAMADLLHKWIEELGGRSEKVLVGFQELDDGQRFDLPPVILAEFHHGPARNAKPTVLIYGHYDVPHPGAPDAWSSDPFQLTEKEGTLFARGVTNNKGPILAWLWAVEIFRELETELPVNLKLCLEGMKESDSECLQDLLDRETARNGFLSDVDYVITNSGSWLTPHTPCLTYGLRGVATFQCEIRAGSKNLHSGHFGGCIAEPMTDIIQLLAAVSKGVHNGIEIPSCRHGDCDPVTDTEKDLYKRISFDPDTFREAAGDVPHLIGDSNTDILMNCWRWPSLSIHGIESGQTDPTFKPIIPGLVTGSFSIRLVPGQTAARVEEEVTSLLKNRFDELRSGNELSVTTSTADAWITDPKGPLYHAAASAFLKAFGVRPDLTREGASVPVVSMLQKSIGADLLVLPFGASDGTPNEENENINRKNYVMGINALFIFLLEIARVHAERNESENGHKKRGAFGRLRDIWYGLS